jgi:hypothetical protein
MNNKSTATIVILIMFLTAGFLAIKPKENTEVVMPATEDKTVNDAKDFSIPTPTPVSDDSKDSSRIAGGYLAGHVDIGPICPVERPGEPCNVPPEVYTSREVVVYTSDKVTVKERIHLDSDGNYKMAIGPGNYFIQIVPAGIGEGEKKPVTVNSFETMIVNFDIDTGIR